jgi:hypothetical protein
VGGGIAQLFLNLGTRSGCVVSITPRPPLPPGKTRYPLYRRLGGHRSRSGQARKISPPTGIRSPDLPARRRVAIPTELSWFHFSCVTEKKDRLSVIPRQCVERDRRSQLFGYFRAGHVVQNRTHERYHVFSVF